jgi:pyruvate kinase
MMSMANSAGKPVVIISQVLDSMVDNPRPTRSEVADIANCVMDGADALCLSGETAIGTYPIESIDTLCKIAIQGIVFIFTPLAEISTNYLDFQNRLMKTITKPVAVSESIASSAVSCARQVDAALVVCFTELGGTARLVAKVYGSRLMSVVSPTNSYFSSNAFRSDCKAVESVLWDCAVSSYWG